MIESISPVNGSRCTINTTPKNAITKLDSRAIKVIILNIILTPLIMALVD